MKTKHEIEGEKLKIKYDVSPSEIDGFNEEKKVASWSIIELNDSVFIIKDPKYEDKLIFKRKK